MSISTVTSVVRPVCHQDDVINTRILKARIRSCIDFGFRRTSRPGCIGITHISTAWPESRYWEALQGRWSSKARNVRIRDWRDWPSASSTLIRDLRVAQSGRRPAGTDRFHAAAHGHARCGGRRLEFWHRWRQAGQGFADSTPCPSRIRAMRTGRDQASAERAASCGAFWNASADHPSGPAIRRSTLRSRRRKVWWPSMASRSPQAARRMSPYSGRAMR